MKVDRLCILNHSGNKSKILTYWQIGRQLNAYRLRKGNKFNAKKSLRLLVKKRIQIRSKKYSRKKIGKMMQFATVFTDPEMIVGLSSQLKWAHIQLLLPLTQPLERVYYMDRCITEKWHKHTLRAMIRQRAYESELLVLYRQGVKIMTAIKDIPTQEALEKKLNR